jgi:Zn-finger nucleic acid-binding protein
MVVLELNEVEIDYCISCRGIWLDAGELELLMEGSSGKDDFLSSLRAEGVTSERPRKCPICDKKMQKVLCGETGSVRIDKCRSGHGIWLDEGELEAILKLACFEEEGRVLNLLRDMFGKGAC